MKKVLLGLLIISTLFLSSCIKMDSNLVINDDLSLEGKTRFDYTQLNSMANGIGSSFSTGTTEEKQEIVMPCDQLTKGTGGLSAGNYEDITCTNIDENIADVIGKGGSLQEVIILKDGNYILDLKSITDLNNKDDEQTETEKINSLNMLKNMGFEMNYSIELPTTIIDFNVGKIDGKTLIFTIYDIINEVDPYVSFENNGKLIEKQVEKIDISLKSRVLLFKKLILSKKELEGTYKGQKDIVKYDKLIPKVNDEKLVELNNRISKIDRLNPLFEKHKSIFNYLEAKIGLEIYKRKIL